MQSIAFIFVGKKNIMGDARMGENLDTLLIIKNVEKSPKWQLINYWALLPNYLDFACKTKGEFDTTSSVT